MRTPARRRLTNGILRANYWSYNIGKFEVSAGAALQFFNGGSPSHVLETNSLISGAGELHLGGAININGTNLISGATKVIGGTANFNTVQGFGSMGTPLLISGGNASLNVNVALSSVTLSGGSLAGINELTIPSGGVFSWTGGAMGAVLEGVTTIAAGGLLAISGSDGKDFTGRIVNNYGTVTWSGTGRIRSTTGGATNIINNLSGAVFEAQSTASIQRNNSPDPILIFNNAGIFRKTGASTTNTFSPVIFNNSGLVELRNGKLQIISGYNVATTGTLSFVISGPTTGVQFGQFETGGAALDGTFSVGLTNGFRPTGCDTFELMRFSSKSGNFANTNGLNLGGGLSFLMNFSNTNLTLVTIDPMPCLGPVASLTNGQFQFQLHGGVGSNYVIQASTNLTAWTPIATNLISGSSFLPFNDPFATNYTQRFYRAVSQ